MYLPPYMVRILCWPQLAQTVEKQLETITDLKDESLKSAKELETAVLRGINTTVQQSLGLPLEQQVRRGVDRGIHAGISDLQNDASRVTFDYIKLLEDSSAVVNNATSKIQETLGLKTMSIIGGSLILSFLLIMGKHPTIPYWTGFQTWGSKSSMNLSLCVGSRLSTSAK